MHRIPQPASAYCARGLTHPSDFPILCRFPGGTSGIRNILARFKHPGLSVMLEFAFFFFALAVIAALLGFFGLIGLAAIMAKVLCVAFLVLFVIATIRRHPRI